jgi:hypothetical protein
MTSLITLLYSGYDLLWLIIVYLGLLLVMCSPCILNNFVFLFFLLSASITL